MVALAWAIVLVATFVIPGLKDSFIKVGDVDGAFYSTAQTVAAIGFVIVSFWELCK